MMLAAFSRTSHKAPGSVASMARVAQQGSEDEQDPDAGAASDSDDDLSSVSDPAWQYTALFTVTQDPVERQLNALQPELRRYQIATALGWHTTDIAADTYVAIRPQDMIASQTHARLVRHISDVPA